MKNINVVKVIRVNDGKRRLYQLPENVTVKKGELLAVSYPNQKGFRLAFATIDNLCAATDDPAMLALLNGADPANLKRVLKGYVAVDMAWPTDADVEPADADDMDDDAEETEEDSGDDE